jgi:peptidoglycan-N-acetylglucosamine deacetylase
LAIGKHQNRTQRLVPGKVMWIAIAAISCAIFVMLHAVFGYLPVNLFNVEIGIAQTVGMTSDIASNNPMNFDVPKYFQAKIIKSLPLGKPDKVIALTFDDGPWPETTEKILATLKQEKIEATFFMIGQPLKSFPEIGKKVLADGHVVANHTMHHWYKQMSPLVAQREIEDTARIIKEVLNVETDYFRPPGGMLNNGLVAYALSRNQSVAMWSIDSGDSRPHRPTPAAMIDTVVSQATPGGIVLMHDGGGSHNNTAKALPVIINKLRAQGYKFVTIPALLELASIPPEPPVAKGTANPPAEITVAPGKV